MTETRSYRALQWVDIDSPTPHEVTALVDKFKLNPLVGEELLRPTRKAKIDAYKDHIYIVLHIPVRGSGKDRGIKEKEIDFIIGKKFIITSKYELIEPLHGFAKSFETNSILDKSGIGDHAGLIFYYIMKRLYSEMMNDLENIKDALGEVEQSIFEGQERKMVEVLSLLSREIIDFRQTIRLHKEVLESFKVAPIEFFGKNFYEYIDDIQSEYNSIHDLIVSNRELLIDLRETNDSLLSTKQNEHMKIFTALAFVTFPLSVIIALFSIPTSHTPIIGMPHDWEIITSGVVVLAVLMYAYFKEKGWI
jgi:magnesium transporter